MTTSSLNNSTHIRDILTLYIFIKDENADLKSKISSLETELERTTEEMKKTEIKMAAITEYFQKKELDLHSKLEAGEQTRKQFESIASNASDKDRTRELEKEQDKKELEYLRAQMKEIEASYVNQVKNHEKRAEEFAVSERSSNEVAFKKKFFQFPHFTFI